MTAILNSHISYENGYITIIESLPKPHRVKDAEVVENNCCGWGKSNAVVEHEGSYYLATIRSSK